MTETEVPDSLLTIAELALGLAGFSGVILAFGGAPERAHPVDVARIHLLLFVTLGTMILSVLPFAFELLGATGPVLWRLSCAATVSYFVFLGAFFGLQLRRTSGSPRSELLGGSIGGRPWALVVAASGFGAFMAPALHAVGLFPDRGAAIIFAVLLWLLVIAAYLFSSIVFVRPDNRSID